MRLKYLLAVATLALAGLAACGGNSTKVEEPTARDIARHFLHALESGNFSTACALWRPSSGERNQYDCAWGVATTFVLASSFWGLPPPKFGELGVLTVERSRKDGTVYQRARVVIKVESSMGPLEVVLRQVQTGNHYDERGWRVVEVR